MMSKPDDLKWMKRALEEGRRGVGLTAPNPPVGAIIVKAGQEIASGWHRRAGEPHAEKEALAQLRPGEADGTTIYVTLEPCSTQGRTGACTDALIKAGVGRVVFGLCDPNPAHAGQAEKILRDAGIEVEGGILADECAKLIRGFAMVQENGRPWVIAKTAMSLDGRITRPPGEGQWLSGKAAREQVQELRAGVEAIITSGETLRRDDPALTLRSPSINRNKKQPWRVVLTRQEINRKGFQLFTDPWRDRTLVFREPKKYDLLRTLAGDPGVTTVLLEAGGRLLGEFQDEGLIDEWVIFLAPLVCGGPSVALAGEGTRTLEDRVALKELSLTRVGEDLCARGVVDRAGPPALER